MDGRRGPGSQASADRRPSRLDVSVIAAAAAACSTLLLRDTRSPSPRGGAAVLLPSPPLHALISEKHLAVFL